MFGHQFSNPRVSTILAWVTGTLLTQPELQEVLIRLYSPDGNLTPIGVDSKFRHKPYFERDGIGSFFGINRDARTGITGAEAAGAGECKPPIQLPLLELLHEGLE